MGICGFERNKQKAKLKWSLFCSFDVMLLLLLVVVSALLSTLDKKCVNLYYARRKQRS